MANASITVIRGQTFKFIAHLKTVDLAGQNAQPYVFQGGDVATAHLPPDPSLAPGVTNVIVTGTINTPQDGDASFVVPATGGVNTSQINIGNNQAIDVWVTHTDGSIDVFEKQAIFNCVAPANP